MKSVVDYDKINIYLICLQFVVCHLRVAYMNHMIAVAQLPVSVSAVNLSTSITLWLGEYRCMPRTTNQHHQPNSKSVVGKTFQSVFLMLTQIEAHEPPKRLATHHVEACFLNWLLYLQEGEMSPVCL